MYDKFIDNVDEEFDIAENVETPSSALVELYLTHLFNLVKNGTASSNNPQARVDRSRNICEIVALNSGLSQEDILKIYEVTEDFSLKNWIINNPNSPHSIIEDAFANYSSGNNDKSNILVNNWHTSVDQMRNIILDIRWSVHDNAQSHYYDRVCFNRFNAASNVNQHSQVLEMLYKISLRYVYDSKTYFDEYLVGSDSDPICGEKTLMTLANNPNLPQRIVEDMVLNLQDNTLFIKLLYRTDLSDEVLHELFRKSPYLGKYVLNNVNCPDWLREMIGLSR